MTKLAELEAQVQALQNLLAQHGLVPPAPMREDGKAADYIEFGSLDHAAFLGVVEIADASEAQDYITFTSLSTGKTYRLEDEITGFVNFPSPEKAALLVLRQKVSSLESGPPQVPPGAPPLWRPADMM